jgi:hypothetical protein
MISGELARQLKHAETVAIVTMPHLLQTVHNAVASDQEISTSIRVCSNFVNLF